MGIKRFFCTLLLSLLLLLSTLLVACHTVSGLQLLLRYTSYYLPGLSIHQTKNLGSELIISQLAYQSTQFSLIIEKLRIRPSLRYLMQGSLGFDQLQIQHLCWQSHHQLQPSTVTVSQLKTAFQWRFTGLSIRDSILDNLTVSWPESTAEPPSPSKNNQSLETSLCYLLQQLPQRSPWPIAIAIESLQGRQWHFSAPHWRQEIEHLQLTADIQPSYCQFQQLTLKTPATQITLKGMLGLQEKYPLSLSLQGELYNSILSGEQWRLQLTGTLRERLTLQLHTLGPLPLQATATLSVTPKHLQIQGILQSTRIQWPLATRSPHWIAEGITLQFSGQPADYHVNLQAKVQAQGFTGSKQLFPVNTDLQCQGKGNQQHLHLHTLRLASSLGVVHANTQISWKPNWQWYSQMTVENCQLTQQPFGKLQFSGTAQSSGKITGQRWQLELPQLQLEGELNGQRLTLNGQLNQTSHQQWHIPHLHILLGNNRLTLQGALGTACDLQATIQAPKLDNLLPGLAGAVSGQITFLGTLQQPQLHSNLSFNQCRWQQLKLEKAIWQSEISTQQQIIKGKTTLQLEQLQHPSFTLEQLQLTANGNEKNHQIQLQVQGKPIAGTLRLQGNFQRDIHRWQARAYPELQTSLGIWRPTQAIQISYRKPEQQLTVAAHHWHHPHAEISIPILHYQAGKTEVKLAIQQLNLALLQPLLPTDLQLEGIISGHSHLQWTSNARYPSITLGLQGRRLKAITWEPKKPLPIECAQWTLHLQLSEKQASLQSQLRLTDQGMIKTTIQITDLHRQQQLLGNLQISALSLLPCAQLLRIEEHFSPGMIEGSVNFAGTLAQPQLLGNLKLKALTSHRLMVPDQKQTGEIKLLFTGKQAKIYGHLPTAKGKLSLLGNAHWHQWQDWKSELHLSGSPMEINWSPQIQLTVIPDIHLESSMKGHKLSGQIDFPQARIIVDESPNDTVIVSKYEVLLNDENQRKISRSLWKTSLINSNLSLRFGEDFHLSAFGLHGYLKGLLKVKQSSQEIGLYGELHIPKGELRAYGQRLFIRRGKLLFSGPIDQLLLDLEAIRDPAKTDDQVVAGLRIKGNSNTPLLTIFSEPASPQTEAFSYLISGHKQATGNSSSLAAQLGLSILQSGKLGGLNRGLAKALSLFYISELSIDTITVGDESQIVLSGYLKRDIQFKYVFSNHSSDFSILSLRFRLRPRLYLEILPMSERGVDLLYQFEF